MAFPPRYIRKNPRSMCARVPHAMAQFVLKIEKLSHIIGIAPILEMARAYGLRPRLWLLSSLNFSHLFNYRIITSFWDFTFVGDCLFCHLAAGLPCQRHENFNPSFLSFVCYKDLAQLCITRKLFHASSLLHVLRWYDTLKYGDVHEKFNFLEIQDLRPLRTCQKHFETILPNFLPDECEI